MFLGGDSPFDKRIALSSSYIKRFVVCTGVSFVYLNVNIPAHECTAQDKYDEPIECKLLRVVTGPQVKITDMQ
jgi:hypothetical protein